MYIEPSKKLLLTKRPARVIIAAALSYFGKGYVDVSEIVSVCSKPPTTRNRSSTRFTRPSN